MTAVLYNQLFDDVPTAVKRLNASGLSAWVLSMTPVKVLGCERVDVVLRFELTMYVYLAHTARSIFPTAELDSLAELNGLSTADFRAV